MALFSDQLQQVVRRLGRAPLFTAITLFTLAIAIGANTVVFSVVDGVLLKPLPYPHPEQLIGVWHTAQGINIKDLNISPSIYFIDREQSTTLEDIGVYQGDSLNVTGAGQPEHVDGLDVTDGTLPLLGVKPAFGRLFTRRDDTAEAPDTVLLSYAYWQRKFGGSPSAIGRSLTIDGKPREVIGVLPQGFHFLDRKDDALILPMKWDRNKTKLGNFSYEALARLKPGVTMQQASTDMARLLPVSVRSFPAPDGFSPALFEKANLQPNLRPLKQDVVGDVGNVLWVLMGSIVMVLLVACANVANLLLVRVEGRRQELAIRSALGAGWKRITTDLLFESAVLGFIGSLMGLALAYGALRLLVAMAPTGSSAHSRDRHQFSGPALHARARATDQRAHRPHPGHEIRRWQLRQRSAGRRPSAEPEPRTPPRAQDPRRRAGRARTRPADLFWPDDPHLPRHDAGLPRLQRGRCPADIPDLYPGHPDTRCAARPRHPHGSGDSGQACRHSRRLLRQLLQCRAHGWRLQQRRTVCAGSRLRRGRAAAHPPLQTYLARNLRHAGHTADRGTRHHLGRHLPEAARRHHLGELREGILA